MFPGGDRELVVSVWVGCQLMDRRLGLDVNRRVGQEAGHRFDDNDPETREEITDRPHEEYDRRCTVATRHMHFLVRNTHYEYEFIAPVHRHDDRSSTCRRVISATTYRVCVGA
ncbi:hypothetical protein EVAR_62969_1 [Eumeta japonica]|uniref:Uncharacterized protein n=1 Tax=Eumeta variegata TaxID=151549 RepID=A0A4C1ZEN9_EUMVA|nr:hypothetical protein EVAR_62969_1 [Eumeta japonica]